MPVSRRWPLVIVFTLASLACGRTTDLTDVWADAQWNGKTINNVLVIGVSKDTATRHAFENYFVERFAKERVTAVSAAKVLGVGRMDSVTIVRYVDNNDIDALLITRLLGTDKEREYLAGGTYIGPTYYGGFYSYYNFGYTMISTPGYLSEATVIKLETNIYQKNGILLWSGVSESFNPGSEMAVIKGLTEAVLDDLYKRGMIF